MATFLQVTARGGFTTGAWSGEVAQCGWSFPVVDFDPLTTQVTNADIEEPTYDDAGGSGTWAYGTYLQGFAGDDLPQAAQQSVADAVYAWMNALRVYQAGAFKWQQIVQQLIQYDDVPPTGWGQKFESSTYSITGGLAGTWTSSQDLPPQCAVAVSHYTESSGSRNRGRVYVPFAKALGSTQLLSSTDIDLLGATEVDLLTAVATIALPGSLHLCPAVVSRKFVSYSSISEVRVGDEVDTQRRRKNARTETYTALPFPEA